MIVETLVQLDRNRLPRALWLTALWLAAATMGCGDGRPAHVPISGQVLIDGQPLTYGSVRFIPDNARASMGKLDSEGRFTLSCFKANDGAVLGTHHVVVMACEPIGGLKVRWHTPKKYADIHTSGLTKEVTEADDAMVINLTWDGGHPFVEIAEGEGAGAGEAPENVPFGKYRDVPEGSTE